MRKCRACKKAQQEHPRLRRRHRRSPTGLPSGNGVHSLSGQVLNWVTPGGLRLILEPRCLMGEMRLR